MHLPADSFFIKRDPQLFKEFAKDPAPHLQKVRDDKLRKRFDLFPLQECDYDRFEPSSEKKR